MKLRYLAMTIVVLSVLMGCKKNMGQEPIAGKATKDVAKIIGQQHNVDDLLKNVELLTETLNRLELTDQTNDALILKYYDASGDHATLRMRGYAIKDDGAANRAEDSIEFLIKDISKEGRNYLLKYARCAQNSDNDLVINLAIPHEYDPGHVVKRSTSKTQVYVVVNIMGDFNRGGWNNTNKLMMFQNAADLDVPFVDDFSDDQYNHYYDGL